MKSYLEGKIIPGESVGIFRIGWSMEKVIENINFQYRIYNTEYGSMLDDIVPNIRFIFSDNDTLRQIVVFKNYSGKFSDLIEVNGKLSKFSGKIKCVQEVFDNEEYYFLPDHNGIALYMDDKVYEEDSCVMSIIVFDKNMGMI